MPSAGPPAATVRWPSACRRTVDFAWLLERRLFDHGYAVHVIHEPENLRQAVRTALAAGLVAIVAIAGPADWDLLQQAVPAEQLVRAENVQQGLEAAARLGRSEGPLPAGTESNALIYSDSSATREYSGHFVR